jgi:cysteine desulfurase
MPELPIYLDHHATTPCDPRVVEKMLPYFSEHFGNPASITHVYGRRAATAIEEARASIAGFFRVRPNEIYFTGGATEANNLLFAGLRLGPGQHVITTEVEHKSVLEPVKRLAAAGVEVTLLRPDRFGLVAAPQLREALRENTRLVSVIAASGEIGTLAPLQELAGVCRERGVRFHTDATQAAGKVPLDFSEIQADFFSISAHKVYGPKGIGALCIRRGNRLEPLLVGGGQEKGIRSGTVNVPAVVGMAAALELRAAEMEEEATRLTLMRNELWDRLVAEIPGATVNGPRERRLPGNLNVSFERVDSEALMMSLRHFALSSGSACSSGEREPSPVLLALGLSDTRALESLRIGLGRTTTQEECMRLVDDLKRSIPRLREISAA